MQGQPHYLTSCDIIFDKSLIKLTWKFHSRGNDMFDMFYKQIKFFDVFGGASTLNSLDLFR